MAHFGPGADTPEGRQLLGKEISPIYFITPQMPPMLIIHGDDDTVSLLLGRGDGTFQDTVAYAVGKGPSGIAIGDFNGDARPDVAVVSRWVNSVTVLPGLAGGT